MFGDKAWGSEVCERFFGELCQLKLASSDDSEKDKRTFGPLVH